MSLCVRLALRVPCPFPAVPHQPSVSCRACQVGLDVLCCVVPCLPLWLRSVGGLCPPRSLRRSGEATTDNHTRADVSSWTVFWLVRGGGDPLPPPRGRV